MKKIVIVFLVFLLTFLVACSNNQESNDTSSEQSSTTESTESTEEEAAPAEKITAEFFTDYAAIGDYLDKLNPAIEANYNASFKVVSYTDPTVYQTTLRGTFDSKDAADIFKWWDGMRMKELIDAGYMADMSKEWEEMIADGVNPALKNSFTFDGKQYGIPGGMHYWPLYYNKKLFAELNLTPPQTWDELMNVCETLKSNNIACFSQSLDMSWMGFIWFEDILIRMYPEVYKKLVAGEAKYTDPEVVEAMQVWKSLYDKGYFYKPTTLLEETAPAFKDRKFAMTLIGTWFSDFFNKAGLVAGEDYDTFVMPSIKPEVGNVVISEITPFLVSANSENLENAKKTLVLLTKKDIYSEFVKLYGGIPIRTDVESSDPVIKALVENVNSNQYELITRYWEATPSVLSEYGSGEFTKFMLNPGSYNEVLTNIEKKAAEYWSSN